jgi:hypothetical protein
MADESTVGDHKLKVAAISLFACVIVANDRRDRMVLPGLP